MYCKHCKEACWASAVDCYTTSMGSFDDYVSDCCADIILDDKGEQLTHNQIENALQKERQDSFVPDADQI